jgi:hypothetical protein
MDKKQDNTTANCAGNSFSWDSAGVPKIGQFLTLWKRIGKGPIQPFDLSDPVECFVVSIRNAENFGQFVFPSSVLCEHDIVSKNGEGGKRAIRVYPPWDQTVSHQAQKAQRWQLDYFLDLSLGRPIDLVRAQILYEQLIGL